MEREHVGSVLTVDCVMTTKEHDTQLESDPVKPESSSSTEANMKTESLIIDVRGQLPWHRRYFTTTMTAMLWAGWLLLCRPLVIGIGYLSIQKPHLVHYFFSTFAQVLENGFFALIACAVSLWLWSNFVPAKTKKEAETKSTAQYASYFNLDIDALMQARQQKIATVHHNAEGRITKIQ